MSETDGKSKQTRAPVAAWVQAADVVAAMLVVLALAVAAYGGVRMRIGGWPFSLTSPGYLVLWALAITAVRHIVTPRPSAFGHWVQRFSAWRTSQSIRAAIIVTLATRPMIFAIGYLAVVLIGYAPNAHPFHDFDSEWLNLPLRWDAGWYLQIATSGYSFLRNAPRSLQQNVVFFPAFPLVVRAFARLAGNTMVTYVVAGTAVSLAFFALALAYLHRLCAGYLTDEESAATLWLLAAYPFALFYGAVYTESMYLAAVLGAFVHFRRRELVRASIWALVAGLTRPNGVFLALPLAVLWIEEGLADRRNAGSVRHGARKADVWALVPVAMPSVGVFLYSIFIYRLTGSLFNWAAGHAAWGRQYQGLSELVLNRYDFISNLGFSAYVTDRPYDFLNAAGVCFVLATVWPVARRFGWSYAVFILINMLPPLASGGLLSAGRLSSVMFPSFMWLATAAPARHRAGWMAGFGAFQALNAVLFYTWRPLY